MDPMNLAVYASAMMKQHLNHSFDDHRPAERWEPSPSVGRRGVLRLATAIGVAAALVGILTLGGR